MYRYENWTIKKAEHQRTDAFELCWRRLLRVPRTVRIKPVNPKGNQLWIFIERTDAETEAPILWPPDVKNWLIWKDPDTGKDWRQEEKGMTEDEMVGWHHQLDGHECEQTLGVGDGQGSLECCGPWGRRQSDRISDWTELAVEMIFFFLLVTNPSTVSSWPPSCIEIQHLRAKGTAWSIPCTCSGQRPDNHRRVCPFLPSTCNPPPELWFYLWPRL